MSNVECQILNSSLTLSQGYFFCLTTCEIFQHIVQNVHLSSYIVKQLAIFSQDWLTMFSHQFLTVAGNNWGWKRDEIIVVTLKHRDHSAEATLMLHFVIIIMIFNSVDQHHHSSDHILCWCSDLDAANQASSELIILLPISSLHY